MKESDLFEPVAEWLRKQGYEVHGEVLIYNRPCDVVGKRGDEYVAIELKTSFTAGVLRQAAFCQIGVQRCYAAAPTRPSKRVREEARRLQIGLLRVSGGMVSVCLEVEECPKRFHESYAPQCCAGTLNRPGGTPCLAGEGPAQAVAALVRTYIADHHPKSWADVYGAITNHYINHRSLAGVMTTRFGIYLRTKEPTP